MTPRRASTATAYRRLAGLGLLLMVLGCIAGIAVPAGLAWDFANFYDAGHKVLVGQTEDLFDANASIAGAPPQGHMAFWGVPLTAYLYAPLALAPPRVALTLFKIVDSLALLGGLFLLLRQLGPFVGNRDEDRARFLAGFVWLALLFQPLWTIFRVGGQTTPLVFLALIFAWSRHRDARFGWSALAFVVAVLIKPSFVTALAFVAVISGVRFFVFTATWMTAAGLLSLVTTGWALHLEFVRKMLHGSSLSTAWMHNSALTVPFENLRMLWDPLPTAEARPVGLLLGVQLTRLLVLFVCARWVWLSRDRPWSAAARRHFHFLVGILFTLLISPIVWEHYLSLLFLPLAYVVASYRSFSRGALCVVGLIFCFSLGQNLVLIRWLDASFSIDTPVTLLGAGLFKAAPLLLTLFFLMRYRNDLFDSYSAAAWDEN